jgi:hypothetical protein
VNGAPASDDVAAEPENAGTRAPANADVARPTDASR